MQNEQRWNENVMTHNGLSGRKMIELYDLDCRKMTEDRKTEDRNCGLDSFTACKLDGQNAEQGQLDGLRNERADERRELVADGRWLGQPERPCG